MDDEIESIHKEVGGEKEEEGSKVDDGDNAGEWEERYGDSYLEDTSGYEEIYGTIASGQGATTTSAKDDDEEEGRMAGIPQFWVYVMGHMEAVE